MELLLAISRFEDRDEYIHNRNLCLHVRQHMSNEGGKAQSTVSTEHS
jgi:hypothetical protein